jgi:OOP family OmpA-OmpF porin
VEVKNIIFIIMGFWFGHFTTTAQNLVPNHSFEEMTLCPGNFTLNEMQTIKGWWQGSEGTPDYFNVCSTKAGVPDNMFGSQLAKDGNAYAGLVLYSISNGTTYREYIQTKLSRPLVAGEMVCVELYYSAAEKCSYVVDGLGMVLSKDKIKHGRKGVISGQTMAMSNPSLNMLDDTESWNLLSDTYVATGGEEYITIGNFKIDKELKVIRRTEDLGKNANTNWAYVYVDNISVKPVKEKTDCSCENEILASMVVDPPLQLSEYKKIKLDDILFDFDKDHLTIDAQKQLEEVYKLLKKNRAMYMEISGHTDIVGPDGYNLELSKRRAQRVIKFLSDKGIAQERLTIAYFGSAKPATDNSTQTGRAQNRRVEFQILERKFELIQ